MRAIYNATGQMIAEKWDNYTTGEMTAHYRYVYDNLGNIVRSVDILGKKEYTYTYEDGNLARAVESSITLSGETVVGKTLTNSIFYIYDEQGRLIRKRIVPVGAQEQNVYYENTDDGTFVRFKVNGQTVTSYSKTDAFGRKTFDELQLGTGFVSRQFTYHAGELSDAHKSEGKVKSTPTTPLVSQMVLSDGRTLSYEYDAEERITKVTDSTGTTTEYTYDALGQLLTETVNGTVVNVMTYDNYGNIKTKNGKVYTYGDATWKDLLTGFDGKTIAYDAQGNPTSYLGHTLTWEKGRQLKSFDGNTYTYNANGIRTSKTINGVKHTYTLDGTKILREVWGSNTLIPLYDNEENVCGIVYNNTPYYFLKNLQGDVIAIINADGESVAKYSYDAWGVCTVTEDNTAVGIATINPYRYRSYYYDEEIGLYYLQSRYYDATVGRFINADVAVNIGFVDSILTNNIYTFCNNDPVNETDIDGAIIFAILKVVGRMLLYATLNVGIQYLADKFLSLIYQKKVKSDQSVYISVALQGAIDGFWNSGFVGNIMKAVIVNLVKQFIDIVWNGKKFEPTQLCEAVFDGIMNGVLDKLSIKSPNYIRDIKAKAREKGIKGTKKLVKYLTKQRIKVKIWNLGLKALKDFCYNVIKNIISTIMKTLQEIVNDTINSVSVEIKEARA